MIMKRGESPKRPRKTQDGMRAEYRFDYAKARPNRFANRMRGNKRVGSLYLISWVALLSPVTRPFLF
jgi:hypothetical protein